MAGRAYRQAKTLADTSRQIIEQAKELHERSKDPSLPEVERERLRTDADRLLDRVFEIGEALK